LYAKVNEVINRISGKEYAALENKKIGLSINVTPAGGTFSWHHDRHEITAIFYLNEFEGGGELEFFPNNRLLLKKQTGVTEMAAGRLRCGRIGRVHGRAHEGESNAETGLDVRDGRHPLHTPCSSRGRGPRPRLRDLCRMTLPERIFPGNSRRIITVTNEFYLRK